MKKKRKNKGQEGKRKLMKIRQKRERHERIVSKERKDECREKRFPIPSSLFLHLSFKIIDYIHFYI